MYHLKISMPGFRQVSVNKPDKVEGSEQVTTTSSAKGHFVYTVEVGFLGEYGQSIERQERMASFYHIERRYSAFLQLHNELRKRCRLPCAFPPKKLRNNTVKVLETRKNQLEQYLQAIVKQCQKTYKPLPQVLLDFLQVGVHVPKIAIERAESRLDDRIEAASHRSIVGFVCKEPFLFESAHALQVSHTGLPDIVTQGTLQCFY